MPHSSKRPRLPTREEILEFIQESPTPVSRHEIARAFHVRGADRGALTAVLRELEEEGLYGKRRQRRPAKSGLPPVTVIEIIGLDDDGDVLAKPQAWSSENPPPAIFLVPTDRSGVAPAAGDRVLARLRRLDDGTYEARAIRRLEASPRDVIGVYSTVGAMGRITPADRRRKTEFAVSEADSAGAVAGDLVRAETRPGKHFGLPHAQIIERLGREDEPSAASLLAIALNDIPVAFPKAAVTLAANAIAAPDAGRADLRDVPLVTIDDAEARDFDDAVWAEPDPSARNKGGWHMVVAIADVAWYVRPGDALDMAARERGNSVYFPDRVVPMLPEDLSAGWCSLKPDEDRPCLAVHIWIDRDGGKRRHEFVRGVMRSRARLTYNQVQAAMDGAPDEATKPLLTDLIEPFYGAFRALRAARDERGALDLDLPERRAILDGDRRIVGIEPRPVLDSHRLIEEFMITANVAAAETLETRKLPCMYRVHDAPPRDKIEALRALLAESGIKLARGQVMRAHHFNRILEQARGTDAESMVNEAVLRSQSRACYIPENIGHFGLGLRRYAHFTSPIRRYADLLAHRALIAALDLGEGKLEKGAERGFEAVAEHISMTERRAAVAERGAMDRIVAAFLADRVGAVFAGRVNGITRFGAFVTLLDSGASGLLPLSALGEERFRVDERIQVIFGRGSRPVLALGERLDVKLAEADATSGSLVLEPAARKNTRKDTRRPRRRKR